MFILFLSLSLCLSHFLILFLSLYIFLSILSFYLSLFLSISLSDSLRMPSSLFISVNRSVFLTLSVSRSSSVFLSLFILRSLFLFSLIIFHTSILFLFHTLFSRLTYLLFSKFSLSFSISLCNPFLLLSPSGSPHLAFFFSACTLPPSLPPFFLRSSVLSLARSSQLIHSLIFLIFGVPFSTYEKICRMGKPNYCHGNKC